MVALEEKSWNQQHQDTTSGNHEWLNMTIHSIVVKSLDQSTEVAINPCWQLNYSMIWKMANNDGLMCKSNINIYIVYLFVYFHATDT